CAGAVAGWLAEARAAAEQFTDNPHPDTSPGGTPTMVAAAAGQRVVGEYEVLEPLGAGGMGEVFKARHRRLGKLVALKLLSGRWHGSPDKTARFLREIKALGSLDHPNIVEAHDAGEDHGVVFLAMKLVEGIDLDRLVRRHGPLPVAEACGLA